MTETVLEKNLKKISKYNPELAKKIADYNNFEANYSVEEAKSGDNILYKDDLPLDDPIDPVWAALDEYKKIQHKSKESITIILGIGLGYIFKEVSKRYKGRIILHEPNLELLRVVLEIVDFSQELDNKKNSYIFITNTYDDIEKAFYTVFFYDYPINVVLSSYYLNNENLCLKTFENKVQEIYGIFQSNFNNLFIKTKLWTSYVFDNIPEIVKNQDLHVLSDKFKGKTAVIISAGPSLDKNIRDLLPHRDNLIVFCVGTALQSALKNGIIPDFVSVLETSKNTFVQLNIPELADINVIIANTTYDEVFTLKPKRFFNYFGNKTPASKWLGTVLEVPIDKYEEAGTVSLAAFYSAKMLGCDKIIFIGQDLAYTDNKCYSQDSIYSGYKIDDSKNVNLENPEETQKILNQHEDVIKSHLEILGKELVEIPGQNGTKVLTRPDMILFIKYFEKLAQEFCSELTLVNATEGGAFLQGFEHITLKEALIKYTVVEKFDVENIVKNHQIKPEKILKRKKIIHSKLNEIMKTYHQSYGIISDYVEKTLFPSFGWEAKDFLDSLSIYLPITYKLSGNELKKYIQILNKLIKTAGCEFTLEELEIVWKGDIIFRSLKNYIKKNIEKASKETPENFNKNLNLIKEAYLNISLILENNAFIKNFYIEDFYKISNKMRNFETFEGEKDYLDSDVIELSKILNYFMVMSYLFSPEYIKCVQQVIKKL